MKTKVTIEKWICDSCGEELPENHLIIESEARYADTNNLGVYWSQSVKKSLIKEDIQLLEFCGKECAKKWIDKLFEPKAKKKPNWAIRD